MKDIDFVGPVQRAIWGKFDATVDGSAFTYTKADGTTGQVRCFDEPPKDTQPPYVCFGEPTSTPYRTKDKNGAKVTMPIFCVTNYAGMKEANSLMGQMASKVTRQKIDLVSDGLVVIIFKQLGSESAKLDDVLAARIVRFEALVMETEAQKT